MNPSDKRNLERIVEFAHQLDEVMLSKSITREQILEDRFIQWAITTPIYNIGEFTSHISKDLKAQHPEIPWSKVAGTRHRLVHDYEGTDWSIIAEILYASLPAYIDQLEALLEQENDQENETS